MARRDVGASDEGTAVAMLERFDAEHISSEMSRTLVVVLHLEMLTRAREYVGHAVERARRCGVATVHGELARGNVVGADAHAMKWGDVAVGAESTPRVVHLHH